MGRFHRLLGPFLAWTFVSSAQPAPAAAPPANRYVPAAGWERDDEPQFYERWFGRHLRAMREPSLTRPNAVRGFRRRFRMLVLPTFTPGYAVRIDETESGQGRVRVVRLTGRGGYAPGRIARQRQLRLSRRDMGEIFRQIEGSGLASLSRQAALPDETQDTIRACFDGTQFVFELLDPGGGHFVTRHDCELEETTLPPLIAALHRRFDPDPSRGR